MKYLQPFQNFWLTESQDPQVGTGKKPKGSSRRLYTDEDPTDTVPVKFRTREDIVETLRSSKFRSKSHKRQSQILNLIEQRCRVALGRTQDPAARHRLERAHNYIKDKCKVSKAKTARLRKSS